MASKQTTFVKKNFKEIGFNTDTETNFKIVEFLDVTFNLINGSYKSYKKPNNTLLYINKNSSHPPLMRHHYLSKYIWEMKDKHNATPNLMWCTVKSVPGCSNISRRCMMCLHEKHEILNYPHQEELLNKRSELVSKCRHVNKFLLSNYKSNY